MQAYKRMSKAATLALFASGVVGVGGVASMAAQAHAQATTTNSAHERGFEHGEHAPITLPQGSITEDAAKAAVTGAYPNLTIKHIRLESENGTVVYSAKLSDDTEAIVDVLTGAVTLETEAQEQAEHAHGEHFGHHRDNDANGTGSLDVQSINTVTGTNTPTVSQ